MNANTRFKAPCRSRAAFPRQYMDHPSGNSPAGLMPSLSPSRVRTPCRRCPSWDLAVGIRCGSWLLRGQWQPRSASIHSCISRIFAGVGGLRSH